MGLRRNKTVLVSLTVLLCTSWLADSFPNSLLSSAVAADSACSGPFSIQLRQSINDLDYPDTVADEIEQMALQWKNDKNEGVVVFWKQKINEAHLAWQKKSISASQLAEIEAEIATLLMNEINKEIQPEISRFELGEVTKDRQANCVGFAQLFLALGKPIGLRVTPTYVDTMDDHFFGDQHVACLVSLSDNRVIEFDLGKGFASRPFVFREQYQESGYYWTLRDAKNPLGIHPSIRMLTVKALASLRYADQAVVNSRQGQYPQAISNYGHALELDTSIADIYCDRGITYSAMEEYDKSIRDFGRALNLNGDHYFALCQRGYAYCKLKDFTQALADCNRAIELHPQHCFAYNVRGRVYRAKGELSKAIDELTRAIQLEPGHYAAYFDRGIAHFKNGDCTEAVADYDRSIELNPRHPEAYLNRGLANAKLGAAEKAKEDISKAVKMKPALEKEANNIIVEYKLGPRSGEAQKSGEKDEKRLP